MSIKWAPVIPLIGGHPLGTEMATGVPPSGIYSYDGFFANDSHYVNYQNSTLGRNIPYEIIDSGKTFEPVDFTVCTPPCAGLSMLNTGKSEAVKGAGCKKNEWMLRVVEDSIEKLQSKVIIIENAPALYTEKGKPFVDRLVEICDRYNRSLTLYKTNTFFHGIPQNRSRTFAFVWDKPTAPILHYYKRDRKNFQEYLAEVDGITSQNDMIIGNNMDRDPCWQYIKTLHPENTREAIRQYGCSSLGYIIKNELLADFKRWVYETEHQKGIKFINHLEAKAAKGLGVWDSSVRVYGDVSNAIISRNLSDTIHPVYDRTMTIREALHMMGHPHDFDTINGLSDYQAITQNVPTCTARDMSLEVIAYLNGQREDSGVKFMKQDNYKEKIEVKLSHPALNI